MLDTNPHPAPALRLFLALWPDAATRGVIAAWQQAWAWPPGAGLVKPERLHLTLHFLGDVPEHRLPDLAAGLRVPFEPFSLDLGDGEIWPYGVAVLRPKRVPRALLSLHTRLGVALDALGLPVEARPFRAHVTLARRAQGATAPGQGPGLRWRADQGYALVCSLPGGAGYEVVERFA